MNKWFYASNFNDEISNVFFGFVLREGLKKTKKGWISTGGGGGVFYQEEHVMSEHANLIIT